VEKSEQSSLGASLREVALAHWNQPALADSSGRALTYGETVKAASRIAAWLRTTRQSEANIGVWLPASVSAATTNYGITFAGKAAVNLNFTAGGSNCRAAMDLCELRTVFSSRSFLQRAGMEAIPEMVFVEDLPPSSEDEIFAASGGGDTTACILFSSGSTGAPKGIELTHWNILANAEGLALRIPPSADDCMLGVLPFFHSFGYTFALWFPVLHGLRAVYHSNPTDTTTIGELAQSHGATYLLSTPTFCYLYAQKIERERFSRMRYVIVGAEKLRDSVAQSFRSHFGIELLAGYGCTELGPGVAVNTPWENRAGSVGRPLKDIQVRIANPDNLDERRNDVEGMILVNGPSRMPGYYKAPRLTSEVIRDGFYVTGDLGYIDSDGFLYVTDRLARFSKVAGEMVPHLRIEEAVSDLTPAFVTGLPDERRGERLVMLYTSAHISPELLVRRLTAAGLPPLWIPKREDMFAVEAIPALASGKVALKLARELAAEMVRRSH
jgi:acyl-[acyl-carrier-protein]-phospholipid O-acyltransferase/long-chain-fatty-acid--[acyl-carrier-protein] ligase